ncbi:MAG TPA: glycosyltransferase, partial [Albitalea sp.]|nr:glycosyltransferase [Albitalea sp.]
MPIVGLATTELPTVISNGHNGFVDTRLDRLVDAMRMLLRDPAEAQRIGDAARRTALERFNIERFVNDWLEALHSVAS